MRPGPIRPGDLILKLSPSAMVVASMRPGPIRPGDLGDHALAEPRPAASMRPGPIRPGDSGGVVGQYWYLSLQ